MSLLPFKNRDITIRLKEGNATGGLDITRNFTLIGVEMVSEETSQSIGEAYGLTDFFLQPWYFKPTKLSIRGISNIGSYAISLLNLSADDTLINMGELLQKLDKIQGDPNRSINIIYGEEEFEGYISDFKKDEDVTKPYLISYNIGFIGRKTSVTIVSAGVLSALKDSASLIKGVIEPVVRLSRVFL